MQKPNFFKVLLGDTLVDTAEKDGTVSRHFEFTLYVLGLT